MEGDRVQANLRDVAAGVVFVAIGGFFALDAWFNLRIGRAFSMGPGYFPALLGTILILLGLAMALMALGKPSEAIGHIPWKGIALIIGSIVFFAVTVRGLGLAPSLFVTSLMAGLSSGKLAPIPAALLSLALTVFCVAVFIYALGLPYPIIGRWLGV
jgi:putative tricarboxylic transport membrane protein